MPNLTCAIDHGETHTVRQVLSFGRRQSEPNPAFETSPQETVVAIDENLQKLRQAIPSGHQSELQNVQQSALNVNSAVGTADSEDSLPKSIKLQLL